jgi:hypothetical protein
LTLRSGGGGVGVGLLGGSIIGVGKEFDQRSAVELVRRTHVRRVKHSGKLESSWSKMEGSLVSFFLFC